MRKYASLLIAAALFAFLSGCASTSGRPAPKTFGLSSWQNGDTVLTKYGYVKGFSDKAETWAWKGIPFAKPPVGELRWKAPRDPEPWEGVRAAKKFGGACTQFNPIFKNSVHGSEDCLYLNIWRPRSEEDGLPVYVWIHGGGNSMGAADMVPDYYGHNIASRSKFVYVSVNYRLGPFGWLYHPALAEGGTLEDASGNFGTLDLIKALAWIKDNIRAFGGDPDNVVITGESAGGMNVLSLLLSPLAEGLFAKAMCQSGAPLESSPDDSRKAAEGILAQLLIKDRKVKSEDEGLAYARSMSAEEIRTYLYGKSDKDIIRAVPGRKLGLGMLNIPTILTDGYVLPREGYAALEAGVYNKVPVVIGSNKEEVKLFLAFNPEFSWKTDLYREIARFGSLSFKARGVDEMARKMTETSGQPPVYAYLFSWGAPDEKGRSPLPGTWGQRFGAFHSLEIPFFLGTDTVEGELLGSILFTKKNEAGRKALSGVMMSYISNFVRTGSPNASDSGLPKWEAWSNAQDAAKCLVFDVKEGNPDVSMMREETTMDTINSSMEKELDGDLLEKVKNYLQTAW